ncbi:MAG TPA: DinB family protein [Fimbriimonadaceae bacterium]|nr:DinB family protein [Fimbriimonadaceae bacterium]
MTIDELVEAWQANNALNLELLDLVADDDFALKPGKGKTIRSNFVHLVGVRRIWLEEKMPAEAKALPKLDWKTATREEIRAGLDGSSSAMEVLFRKKEAGKPGKWSTLMFFAYCIAHEAHHRSQIEISLRMAGREPEDAVLYGLWEWSKK